MANPQLHARFLPFFHFEYSIYLRPVIDYFTPLQSLRSGYFGDNDPFQYVPTRSGYAADAIIASMV